MKLLKYSFGYRLPTEAEWEFAARGRNESKRYKYLGSKNPDEVAWYSSNSGGYTREVGTKKPNELGIYDMSGNVHEWCQDWYNIDYYKTSQNMNPYNYKEGNNFKNGLQKILRGGCWSKYAIDLLVANREHDIPEIDSEHYGFRVCRTIK